MRCNHDSSCDLPVAEASCRHQIVASLISENSLTTLTEVAIGMSMPKCLELDGSTAPANLISKIRRKPRRNITVTLPWINASWVIGWVMMCKNHNFALGFGDGDCKNLVIEPSKVVVRASQCFSTEQSVM